MMQVVVWGAGLVCGAYGERNMVDAERSEKSLDLIVFKKENWTWEGELQALRLLGYRQVTAVGGGRCTLFVEVIHC